MGRKILIVVAALTMLMVPAFAFADVAAVPVGGYNAGRTLVIAIAAVVIVTVIILAAIISRRKK